ncbi:hypothetical protein ACFVWG_31445 [Kribbella sp. NPDC058245]|uniref:hypothetical protein n=1 Tax=Kribbella sp. NPDC058245 TaxID=3346399 RepID=UPI0036E20FE9
MNDDNWTTLQSAGKVPPPSPEVLAHAAQRVQKTAVRSTRRNTVRHRVLTPVLAATGTAAVIGVVALQQSGTPTANPAGGGSTSAAPATATQPTPARTTGKPLGPAENSANSCAFAYGPAELAKADFAFDGTVVSAVPNPYREAMPRTWTVTFTVHEWFRPSTGGTQTKALLWAGPGGRVQVSDHESYEIGDRLLISGRTDTGVTEPLIPPHAWGCGFSRTYDEATAATWRKVLSR